eukprot:6192279-Pleurochrysis_carterae.AAC.1
MAPVSRATAPLRVPPWTPGVARVCRRGSGAVPHLARRSCRGRPRGCRPPPWQVPPVGRVSPAPAPQAARGRARVILVGRACLLPP